jgi:formyltetrahydrofolate synthetase
MKNNEKRLFYYLCETMKSIKKKSPFLIHSLLLLNNLLSIEDEDIFKKIKLEINQYNLVDSINKMIYIHDNVENEEFDSNFKLFSSKLYYNSFDSQEINSIIIDETKNDEKEKKVSYQDEESLNNEIDRLLNSVYKLD